MSARECQVDLLQRERNAALSERDRVALAAHLESCASCRSTRRVVADFQAQNALLASDGARIERLAELAARRVSARSRPARRRAVTRAMLLLAAAFCLFAASAAAGLWRAHRISPVQGASPSAHLQPVSSVSPAPATTTATPSEVEAVASSSAPAPIAAPAASAATGSSGARAAVTSESASELLHRAANAKLAGDRPLAIELYKKLSREFPSSHEAQVSRVSLGRLLADSGYPSAALREYELYLTGSQGGALIQEALYGKARALAALGDRAEESRTWRRLLRDFPAGAYAATAQRRLLDLE